MLRVKKVKGLSRTRVRVRVRVQARVMVWVKVLVQDEDKVYKYRHVSEKGVHNTVRVKVGSGLRVRVRG